MEKIAIPMTDFPLITVEQDDHTHILGVTIEKESLEDAMGYLEELLRNPKEVFKPEKFSQGTIDNFIRVFNALYYITKDAIKRVKSPDTVQAR